MSNLNLQERLPSEERDAALPAAQLILKTLSALRDEVAELRERVAFLENGHSLVPAENDSAPEPHPYAKIFGSLSGEIWDEIFEEMECERQREIAAEEAAESIKAA